MEWRSENEQLGLAPDINDTWTPMQRQRFLQDWQDDEIMLQPVRGQKRSYEEMAADDDWAPVTQVGRGHKRSHEEMDDDDDSDGIPFIVESVKQVNVKKFKTTDMNYRIQFTNAFADVELSNFHNQLHEIFQRILDETIRGVPPDDQVRFVLHSQQLEQPISFPFLPRHRLTTERVLAEFERVIQSNQEFRLNDTVDVNVIHVVMPQGGWGSKRSEINLEKHLAKKRSIVRIQNSDDLCLARALVAKAKIDNDPQYKYIADHRKPMQTRLAEELHQKSGVPLGPCGLDEVKHFQTYLSEYQINVVCKEYMNSIIFLLVLSKRKGSICSCTTTITMSSRRCRGFSHEKDTAIHARRPTIIMKSIYVPTSANVVVFRTVPLCHGFIAMIVSVCSRVNHVLIGINSRWEMHFPFARALSSAPSAIKCSNSIKESPKVITVV